MAEISDEARSYKSGMRVAGLLSVVALVGAIGGFRGWVPVPVGFLSGAVFIAAAGVATMLGARAHRQLVADREKQNRMGMILMAASQLGKQDDATLEGIAARGGLAGDAASLILQGRREKRERESPPALG